MTFKEFSTKNPDLTLVPLKNKIPQVKWKQYRETPPTIADYDTWDRKEYELGILTGDIECLDIDEKRNIAGEEPLIKQWSDIVKDIDATILEKVLVTSTTNGGWHIIYYCDEVEGNMKLASRLPVGDEIERSVTLIETRGQGGLIAMYEAVKGSWDAIPTLTVDERDIVLSAARSLNRVIKKEKVTVPKEYENVGGLSPLDDWQQQQDISSIAGLLEDHGWAVVCETGDKFFLRRPGKQVGGASAVLDDFFYCWSTSTEFPAEEGITYAGVLTHLEYDGDASACAKALAKEGYGEQISDRERRELVDKMLGREEEILSSDEELAVLARITDARQGMLDYLEYAATKRNFHLPAHLSHLQDLMKDIQPSHYVAWAASSGVGKTSTIRQIINAYLNVTSQEGVFCSMEMPKRDLALRNAMELSEAHKGNYVDKDIVTEKLISDEQYRESVINSWDNFFTIDNEYDLEVVFQMCEVFVKHRRRSGKQVGVVVIDFLQLANGGHSIDKQPELAQKMKLWAKKLDVIVIGLLQMNSTMDRYTEPNENNISGHKALFQTADHGYLLWKNASEKNRVIIKSGKERWSLESRCDLVQTGMAIHSEEHLPVDESVIAGMAGNRGLRSQGGRNG